MNDTITAADRRQAELVGEIYDDERRLAAEHRESVRQVYEERIRRRKWELATLNPDHPLIRTPPDPAAVELVPVDIVRRDLNHFVGIWENLENATHVRGIALINIAEAQAELHRLTGAEVGITVEDARAHYNAMLAEKERVAASPPPPTGHSNVSTRDGRFQRHTMQRTTELVQSPEQAVMAARRRGFAEQRAANQHLAFSGPRGEDRIPNPTASSAGFDLNSRNPTTTRRVHLSGRTAD
jgi:hypothetical protein